MLDPPVSNEYFPQEQSSPDVPPHVSRVLEMIVDAFVALDAGDHYAYVNQQAERLFGRSRKELLGLNAWQAFPDGDIAPFRQAAVRARSEQTPASSGVFAPIPGRWLESHVYPSPDGLLFVYFRDITETQQMQADHAQEQMRLRDRAIAASSSGIVICDPYQLDCPIIYCNPAFTAMTGYPLDEVIGRNCRFLQGEDTDRRQVQLLRESLRDQQHCRVVLRNYRKNGAPFWNELVLSPVWDSRGSLTHFIGVQTDVTEREDATVALRLAEEQARRGQEQMQLVLKGGALGIWHLDLASGLFLALSEQCRLSLGLPLETDLSYKALLECIHPDDRSQVHAAIDEAMRTGEDYAGEYRCIWPNGEVHWVEARGTPTRDTEGHITQLFGIMQEVTSRVRAGESLRLRAEHEGFLARIGQALLSSPDPLMIQEKVATLLGEFLGSDRCYFVTYDYARRHLWVAEELRRPNLPSLAGLYSVQGFDALLDALLGAGTRAISDVQAELAPELAERMAGYSLRSLIVVPFLEAGRPASALFAAMTHTTRLWTAEEVGLVETVAVQTRAAVEVARVAERERKIATQLQSALQPELPDRVPGLALAKYYQASHGEAGVGGDFYDVFPLKESCTALVVGDLTGKGLDAAAQVATVRNMLRAFLYTRSTVAEAVTEMNCVLAENSLLTGFATLFVGVYSSAARVLTYVNCGQEPALLRRAATGAVEMLVATGPIVGAFANASYQECSLALSPGDAVAIFTDGLSEVGASRTAMLGMDGLAALLAEPEVEEIPEQFAEALSQRLIQGVTEFAEAGIHDDMCLLIAVVKV